MGIGGKSTFTSHDGDVLRYIPDIDGAWLANVSPVPLEIKVHAEFPEVTKSGFGRPKMATGSARTTGAECTFNNMANVEGGTRGKGFVMDFSGIVQPGGHVRFKWIDLDNPGPPPLVDISASDDYGGLGSVVPVSQREVVESDQDPSVIDVTPPPQGAKVVSWNGTTNSSGMGLEQYSSDFPSGVTVASVVTSQGVRQAISNLSGTVYTVQLMYYLGNYAGGWYISGNGNFDGEALSSNGHSRVVAYLDFAPGVTFYCEPDTSGNYSSYSSITFRNCQFSDRYVFGATS